MQIQAPTDQVCFSDYFALHYPTIFSVIGDEADRLATENDNPSTAWYYDTIRFMASTLIHKPEWQWIRWDNTLNEAVPHYLQQKCVDGFKWCHKRVLLAHLNAEVIFAMAWSLCESDIPKDKWKNLRWNTTKHGVPMIPEVYEDEIEDPDNATRRTPSPETYNDSMPTEEIIELTSAPPGADKSDAGTKHGHDKSQQPYKKYRTENSSYSQPSSSW